MDTKANGQSGAEPRRAGQGAGGEEAVERLTQSERAALDARMRQRVDEARKRRNERLKRVKVMYI